MVDEHGRDRETECARTVCGKRHTVKTPISP